MMEEAGLGPADINMGVTEVVLVIIGVVVFAASFFIPEKHTKKEEGAAKVWEEKIKTFFVQQIKIAKDNLDDKADEIMSSSYQKAERSMERITNEKIMAVQEYSDTVLEQIHKNHEEAVFLYDMLNSKHTQIKFTTGEINAAMGAAKGNLENAAKDALQDILKKSVENNLQEQIENIVTDTIESSIKKAVKDSLEERIQAELQNSIENTAKGTFFNRVKETKEKMTYGSDTSASGDEAASSELSKELPVNEIFSAAVRGAGEESRLSEEAFQKLELTVPEVIVQEEQPFFVQPVKKVEPKKKTRSKKNSPRILETVNIQPDTEKLPDKEKELAGSNKEKILHLHKVGKTDIDIARELGLGIGEVRLVIGLFDGVL